MIGYIILYNTFISVSCKIVQHIHLRNCKQICSSLSFRKKWRQLRVLNKIVYDLRPVILCGVVRIECNIDDFIALQSDTCL